MLSSDSEADEFFDAEDTNGIAKNLLLLEKKKRKQDNLAVEENRILELRRLTEERRRHEDEELAHRLQELHSRKEKRVSANTENIRDETPDDEVRRQKLEMLRSQLSTDSTPNKEPDTLDTVFITSLHAADSESQEFRSEYTDTGQKQDQADPLRLDTISDNVDFGVGAKHDHLLLSREMDQRESKLSGLSGNLDKNKPESCVLSTSVLDDQRPLHVKLPECDMTGPKSPEKFWGQSKNIDRGYPIKEKLIKEIPEIVPEQCVIVGHVNQKLEDLIRDSLQSTSSKLDDSVSEVFIHNSDDEPDIVKSTKSRNTTPTQSLGREVNPSNIQMLVREVSPPDTLLPPVAPPRRKKRNRTAQASNSIIESSTEHPRLSSISVEPMSPGLPPSVHTPTSDIIKHLSKDFEHSLDIQSAIDGKRHIRTEEAEIGAINSDKSISPDLSHILLREQLRLKRLSEETSPSGTSSLPSSPRTKRPERTISTQSHSDEDIALRPRSNSGRLLTDEEILESVMVLNLDTGEQIPLSVAEEKLAKCMNPLALYIMRRTKEYNSDSNLQKHLDNLTDDDVDAKSEGGLSSGSSEQSAKTKAVKLKKFIGKTMGKTMHKVKHAAEQGRKVLEGDETGMEEEFSVDGKRFKFKASRQNKGPYDFSRFRILQDLAGEHTGAVWTMRFSTCGRLLATGGQDSILRVWVLKSAHAYFEELRQKYSDVRVSPAPSHESLDSISSDNSAGAVGGTDDGDKHAPFMKKPFCVYRGHIADLLDLSWSKNYFILSSSMDKTVRLWHISRKECLCTFQHIDFVTAIAFHPRDDRYFLSGSLDGKLRLWNIPDKNVALWNEVGSPSNLITTANFCQNGKFAVVGTYDGKCIFYSTEQLKYYTQIHVRSTRGKNARGRKITGIEPLPTEDKILVTSNDSRIRLYDLRDLTLTGKYKGCTNNSSQIKASFSSGGKYIICGSEDQFMYIWKTHHDYYKFSSARRDRNDYWEAIKVHNAVVTTAIFASHPMLFFPDHDAQVPPPLSDESSSQQGEIIISADFSGTIKVIQNKISVIA